jgi:8-oxo-dGTP diphosphatase
MALSGSGTKVILEYEGRILAYQRTDDPGIPFPGRWDLFGGGLEPDDASLLACGVREVGEELGIGDIELEMIEVVESAYTPGRLLGRAYGRLTARQVGGIIFSEGQTFGLFTPEEIAELDFVPELQEFVLAWSSLSNREETLEKIA